MRKDTEKALKEVLGEHFASHGSRLDLMSKLILTLIIYSTVNLSRLSLGLNHNVKPSSNFKRLQRFFRQYRFDKGALVRFGWRVGDQGQWVALAMDRTNWKFGKRNINILLLGISYRGVCIPLIWKMLDKRGNSNEQERIELVRELLGYLDKSQKDKIRFLLLDREFCGAEWFEFLKKQQIGILIRLRKNTKVRKFGYEKEVAVSRLFSSTNFKVLNKPRILFGHRMFLSGQKLEASGDYLILASDQKVQPTKLLYAERWAIETLFGNLKTRGFNFEQTHITNIERLSTLVFVLSIAFIWAFQTGILLTEKGILIRKIKTNNRTIALKSIFRHGFDFLTAKITGNASIYEQIKLLSCT